MLIVVEGVDRTGKTTLANRLAAEVGGDVVHAGPPTRGSVEEYETSLNNYDPRETKHLILDRWHVGEHVWPTIFDRKTDMDIAVKRHVDMFMESRGAVVVYATNDREFLKEELRKHDEPLLPEKLEKAEHLFTAARVFSSRPAFNWDYRFDDQESINEIAEAAQSKAEEISKIWSVLGPGFITGDISPQVLLVGDEQGPEKGTRSEPTKVPFAPFPATSGHYLLQALTNWRRTALVNSCDRDTGKLTSLVAAWKAFGKPLTIALGKKAAMRLDHQGVPCVAVHHPQYWRRFHHHDIEGYTKEITPYG